LAKERSTATEGSFGTQKTSYGLQKVKAKKSGTEVIWIFFGVMTANAVKISRRKATAITEQHNQAA
jgi:transposase, IS5 family